MSTNPSAKPEVSSVKPKTGRAKRDPAAPKPPRGKKVVVSEEIKSDILDETPKNSAQQELAPKFEPVSQVLEPIKEEEEENEVKEKVVETEDEKGGKRAKKQRMSRQLVDEVESLLQTLQKDLASGKLDKYGEKVIKRYIKELVKINQKAQKIQKKPSTTSVATPASEGKVSQSGFSKPYRVSDELALFAGWEQGTQKSRTEINNFLCAYIKSNGLQASEDKRVIVPDEALRSLLKYNEGVHGRLDFAQMQKFISQLIVKPVQVQQ